MTNVIRGTAYTWKCVEWMRDTFFDEADYIVGCDILTNYELITHSVFLEWVKDNKERTIFMNKIFQKRKELYSNKLR